MKGKLVTITAKRYLELLKVEDELSALNCVGVDNWSGYGEHREEMRSDEELIEEVNSKVIN